LVYRFINSYFGAMKRLVGVVVMKKEEDISLARRRDDYALKRDLLAADNNNAISRRLLPEKKDLIRCTICGKEFATEKSSIYNEKCPDCR
jgi:DNA-directed RNA polymerase subunit RPC12/RpoP